MCPKKTDSTYKSKKIILFVRQRQRNFGYFSCWIIIYNCIRCKKCKCTVTTRKINTPSFRMTSALCNRSILFTQYYTMIVFFWAQQVYAVWIAVRTTGQQLQSCAKQHTTAILCRFIYHAQTSYLCQGQGCSGAGARGNGVPTSFSGIALKISSKLFENG